MRHALGSTLCLPSRRVSSAIDHAVGVALKIDRADSHADSDGTVEAGENEDVWQYIRWGETDELARA